MKKGDIVLVRFPFTDLSSDKLRPAVVLAVGQDDICLAFITTHLEQEERFDVLIAGSKAIGAGLKRDSLVKVGKLATLSRRILVGRLGSLSQDVLQQVDVGLRSVLQL